MAEMTVRERAARALYDIEPERNKGEPIPWEEVASDWHDRYYACADAVLVAIATGQGSKPDRLTMSERLQLVEIARGANDDVQKAALALLADAMHPPVMVPAIVIHLGLVS